MSYPASPEFSAVNVDSEHSNVRSETRSGRTQVRSLGAHRWKFSAKYNVLTRAQFAPVYAFIVSTGSGVDSFSITPPVISDTSGTMSGTLLVDGAHSVGDKTITVDGGSGTIKAGDFIKFDGHAKVYMVTADLTGDGTLNIFPGLISSLSNDEEVIYSGVEFRMRVDGDVQQFSLAGYDQYNYEVDMIEVI